MEPATLRVAKLRAELEAAEAELRVAKLKAELAAEAAAEAKEQEPIPPPAVPKPFLKGAGSLFCPETASTCAATSVRSEPTIMNLGGMSDDETATVPMDTSDAGADSDDSTKPGNLGASSATTKRSKARASGQRGPRRAARDLARAQSKWAAENREILQKGEQARRNLEVSTGLHGSEAVAAQARIVEAATAAKITETEKKETFVRMLTEMTKALSDTVVACAAMEGLDIGTSTHFVRANENGPYCHLCKKQCDWNHANSAGHREHINLSASISWMCGGLPCYLRAPHTGCPTWGNPLTQAMCKAWWGPHVDSLRDRAIRMYQNMKTVVLQSNKSCVEIPTSELVPGSLWFVPYEAGEGMYERAARKGNKEVVRALEWNSIPQGLGLTASGVWAEPQNEEEAVLMRLTEDKMKQGEFEEGKGYWPVLSWQPSATASPRTIACLSDAEYMWVSCIIQWLEALMRIIAWRLNRAMMQG